MSDEVKDQGKEVKPEEQKPVQAAPAADGAEAKKEQEKPKEEPKEETAKVEDEYDDDYWDDIEEEEEEEAKKRRRKIILGTIVAIIVICALATYIYVSKLGKYNNAVSLYEAGQYSEAAIAFEEVGSFQDAARYAQKSYYEQGGQYLLAGDFEAAKAAFEAAGDYDNAAEMVVKSDYRQAIALFESGDAEAAAAIFANLAGYNQADMYLEWANAKAKYAEYDPNANLFGDGYADWRAAEAGLAAVVYGTWYNAETGEALEIGTATIGGQTYAITAAEGIGNNVTFVGYFVDSQEAYRVDVLPAFVNPGVNELVLNDVVYYNVTPEDYQAIVEAKANGEYVVEDLAAQRYTNDTVVNKALDMFVATTKEPVPAEEVTEAVIVEETVAEEGTTEEVAAVEETVTEEATAEETATVEATPAEEVAVAEATEEAAPAEETVAEEGTTEEVAAVEETVTEEATVEEAVTEEKSFTEKLLALVPAHYTADDAVVTYDAESKVYDVAFNAVYIENAMSVFKKAECPTYAVEAKFVDTGAGLKALEFAVVDSVSEEVAEAAEETVAEEGTTEEVAPAEETVTEEVTTEEVAPVEETVTEETTAEEVAPTEETVAEEGTTEEVAPAEETVTEETTAEEVVTEE